VRFVFPLFVLLILLTSCQSYPRYRTGEAKRPNSENKANANSSSITKQYKAGHKVGTTDLIRLGRLIQSYLGRPYKGKSKYEKGLDCSQFTQDVYKKFNKTNLPRTAAKQFEAGIKVNQRNLKFGDLVFLSSPAGPFYHFDDLTENMFAPCF